MISNTFRTLASTTYTNAEREKHDFYATEPKAVKLLLEVEDFSNNIWECASGQGHISKVLEEAGYDVWNTDLVDRGYQHDLIDFLNWRGEYRGDIITNPPYKFGKQFVEKALSVIPKGNKVAMFTKLLFLESKGRKKLFTEQPPKTVYVSSSRLHCAKNGEFDKYPSSVVAYVWIVWEKGYKGDTVVKWIN